MPKLPRLGGKTHQSGLLPRSPTPHPCTAFLRIAHSSPRPPLLPAADAQGQLPQDARPAAERPRTRPAPGRPELRTSAGVRTWPAAAAVLAHSPRRTTQPQLRRGGPRFSLRRRRWPGRPAPAFAGEGKGRWWARSPCARPAPARCCPPACPDGARSAAVAVAAAAAAPPLPSPCALRLPVPRPPPS